MVTRIVAVVAVVTSILTLYVLLTDALGLSDKAKLDQAALDHQRAAATADRPILDVSYVFMTPDLIFAASSPRGTQRALTRAAATITSYPALANAATSPVYTRVDRKCRTHHTTNSTTFLVVRNGGRHAVGQITISLDRLTLRRSVYVRDITDRGGGYARRLRARAAGSSPVTMHIAESLEPGDGVRLPLFSSSEHYPNYNSWCTTSRVAMVPRTVIFMDTLTLVPASKSVRGMLNPLVFDTGVVGRG